MKYFRIKLFSVILFAVSLVCFVFSGCNIMDISNGGVEDIMQPPMPDKEKYEIKLALDKVVKGSVTLKSPKSGSFITSYTEYDLDGDDTDEAIVFYQEKISGKTVLYIHLFRKDGNEWVSAERIEGSGSDVFSLRFDDLNDDGICEILVMWEHSGTQQNTRTLAIYDFLEGRLEYGATKECDDVTVVDLIPDNNRQEIVTFTLEKTDTSTVSKAGICTYYERVFSPYGELELNDEVIGYAKVSANSNKDINGTECFARVVVDSYYRDYQQLLTQVIYWDVDSWSPTALSLPSDMTNRKSTITSGDINRDGIIEIPTLINFANTVNDGEDFSYGEGYATREHIVAWMSYNDNCFNAEVYTVSNPDFNYTVKIPEEWIEDIALVDHDLNNEYTFYKWDKEKNEPIGTYASVRVFKAADWEKIEHKADNSYTKIKTNKAGTLIYTFGTGDFGRPEELDILING